MTEEASTKQKNKVARTQREYETLLIGNDTLALSPALAGLQRPVRGRGRALNSRTL